MSRIQFMRQMLPCICKDFYEMEIYHNPTGAATFDPSITTSASTSVIWQTEAGTTVTTGTTHNFSYTPTAGPKKCTVTVRGGLGLVTGLDFRSDAMSSLSSIPKLINLTSIDSWENTLITQLTEFRSGKMIRLAADYVARGSLSVISNNPLTHIGLTGCFLGGSLSDVPASCLTCLLVGSTGVTPASIAHLIAIRDLRIYSMGWNAAGVDTVLLSASDAVWTNVDHYTYSSPSMQIGGTNAAPGGSSGADTTNPMTTPGSGNSNSDWQWDAGKSAHKALTGKAAVYYLTHLATHQWAITYT